MRRLLGARFNAEDAEIPQDYTSQGAVLLLRLCNQHPGLVEVVGSQSFSPSQARAGVVPSSFYLQKAEGKCRLFEHQMLCAGGVCTPLGNTGCVGS